MKKNYFYLLRIVIAFLALLIILIGCEPISVSVNSDGEIAFTRSEGLFFVNLKTGKLSTLDWNFGKETIPVIVRWSPKADMLAFTVKENKDSQSTTVYLINRKGEKNKIYSVEKIITQMEWAKDGKYLSIAQAGENSDLGVADLAIISIKDGMTKVFAQSCGDVHKWLDENSISFIKINKKSTTNSEVFQGELSSYNLTNQKIEMLGNVFVSKTGALDCSKARGEIIYTAIKATDKAEDFPAEIKTDSYLYSYSIKDKKSVKLLEDVANFALYSPDEKNLLIKAKNSDGNINLVSYNFASKKSTVLVKNTVDTVTANSSAVQAYPAWYNNETVLFWRLNRNYASNGESLNLMSVNTATMKKQNLQPAIDNEVNKLVEEKGGY